MYRCFVCIDVWFVRKCVFVNNNVYNDSILLCRQQSNTHSTQQVRKENVCLLVSTMTNTQRVSETERKKYKLTHNPNENDHEILSCISV